MQQIIEGIANLGPLVRPNGKALLVCDSSYPYLSIREAVERLPVALVKFDQFTPNPLYEDVCKGVELFQQERCQQIIAIGGGSSIDVAKCIKLYCKMDAGQCYLEQEYRDSLVPLTAIPTTAGTGSESTRYAVIYYQGKKQSVTHDSIIPNIAMLEPSVLQSLPLYQKKCTLLDALCQGIESWWSVNSTEESKQYSRTAVETIAKHWRPYIEANDSHAARELMRASNLAGQAICITQTTAAHAFSYKITSLFGIPHGHAVALGLPHIWRYMLQHPEQCIDSRGQVYLTSIFNDIAHALGAESPTQAIALFDSMMQQMQLQQRIANCSEEQIQVLTLSVNPIRLKNNPVQLDHDAIAAIYHILAQ